MTRWIGVGSAVVSIVMIGLVLAWGLSGRAGTPLFETAVFILGIATPLASLLLSWHLWRLGRRAGAALGGTPCLIMVAGVVLAFRGAPLALGPLLWLDFYILLVFIGVLSRFGPELLRPGRQIAKATAGRAD